MQSYKYLKNQAEYQHCCRRRRFDQMCRFRFDQGAPDECAGQSLIGTTPLNWSICGRRQHSSTTPADVRGRIDRAKSSRKNNFTFSDVQERGCSSTTAELCAGVQPDPAA